jgi:hypothetical protein
VADLKTVSPDGGAKTPRGSAPKSGTQFPYFNLDDSIAVSRAIHERGGGNCGKDLAAAALGYGTTKSGTFMARIYAAKQFGLIRIEGEMLFNTERAISILHPVMETDAQIGRRDAFLDVSLFQKVYEKFKGQALPPEVGLQNLLKTEYKIVEDRIKPALRVLMDSAEQAGFFAATGNRTRMIAPTGVVHTSTSANLQPQQATISGSDAPKPAVTGSGGGGDGPPPSGVHPAIVALMRELPRPGSAWPVLKKERFMKGLRGVIDIVYPDSQEEGAP